LGYQVIPGRNLLFWGCVNALTIFDTLSCLPTSEGFDTCLVKDGLGAVALAIDNGASNVSMIQAADVGVGILGGSSV